MDRPGFRKDAKQLFERWGWSPGAEPTAARISDRLSDIVASLRKGGADHDVALDDLQSLRRSLDAWASLSFLDARELREIFGDDTTRRIGAVRSDLH